METKVKVKSLISSHVLLSVPELRLRREWEKKGAIKIIPFEQLEEAMYNPGVEALCKEGALGIDDLEVKIALGLEPDGAVEPVNIVILNDAQRERYLRNMPMVEFRQKVKELPQEQLIELAEYAIAHEIADFDKSDLLLRLTDIDVMGAIRLNRDNNEVVKEG